MAEKQNTPISAYKPKQVLLIGLGGVGGKVANLIMSRVPEEYKPYTQAVSIDTDITEIKVHTHIPLENQIVLGNNTTIGKFMKDNPDTENWMVKGTQLDLLRSRNTKNGAKQIRLVSRIALRATNSQGHLGRRIEQAIHKLNAADGKVDGNGLLVLVICSVAGGTGAGTVIQVPMYLEDAIRNSYTSENVQFECAMLMPNAFSSTLSIENLANAKVNGYAVMRELMSLNTGRLKRFEYFEPHEVDTADERIAPYGRIMLFDSINGKGESVTGAVDTVHIPLMADSLIEYLFGPANGKIMSALDNTLKRVYDTNGAGIFGAVGKSALVYPRALYKQYSVSKWVSSTLSTTWLHADQKANEAYREEIRMARENGTPKPAKESIYAHYIRAVTESSDVFFREICRQLIPADEASDLSLAETYWETVINYIEEKLIKNNEALHEASNGVTLNDSFTYRKRRGLSTAKDGFRKYYSALVSLGDSIPTIESDIMRPVEAQKPSFYSKDRNKIRINTFIRDHNLHPIALRCFLYDLYSVLQYNITGATVPNPDEKPDSEWDNILESKKNRDIRVNEERNSMLDSAKLWLKSMLAERMIVDLVELIHEIEDLFESVNKVKEYFDNSAVDCLEEIDRRNDRADTVIAGSKLSAVNCWKLLEGKIHAGDEGGDDDIIDDDLSAELNNLIYNGYYKHVNANAKTTISLGGEDFRIPTDYVEVLRSRLQRHFMHKITLTYGKLFPENVVDAIRYDCGVKNYWNILQSNSSHLTLDDFVCTTPYEKSFYDQAREKGLAAFDVTETLNRLLSLAIGKSEPRCGLVSISADADYTNRYIVLNKSILTKKTSFSGAENDEETDITEELSYIIPGVSTSMVEGVNVNACFTGSSPDYIACMTTYSGLEPSNFTALLAPIFDKNAPQDAMSYYRAYREYINEVVTDPTKITPHLDRSWHIADRLADITAEYTTSVWKHAAKAFVYGFVYNVIKVTLDGSVFFGDYNNNIFKDIGHDGTLTVTFISPAQQAALANPATSTAEKKDLLNAILNKVFERLTNDPALSTAIIQYGEAQLAEDRMFAKAGFLKMALEEENVASASYNCILDVIDGYYNGSYKAKHIEKNYAIESSQYMFDVVITSIFNQIKSLTASPAEVENTAKQTVQLLYKKAVCDNPAPVAVAAVSDFGGADPQSDLEAQNMLAGILGGITASSVASANQKPFAPGGRFELNRALHMIDQLLRESEN